MTHQPAHILVFNFVQIKVGKQHNFVSEDSVYQSLQFSLAGKANFETIQCNQMTNVGLDVKWNTARRPPPNANKRYQIEGHFQLITSRNVSHDLKKTLQDAKIVLTKAIHPSNWGKRVASYCSSTDFVPFTTVVK